jgi:hypothetical protein
MLQFLIKIIKENTSWKICRKNQTPQDKKGILVSKIKWEDEDGEGGQTDERGEQKAKQASFCKVPSATNEVGPSADWGSVSE